MFLINYVRNCSENYSELLQFHFQNSSSIDRDSFDKSANIFIAIFAIFGFVTNTLTVFTLSQPRFKSRSHNLRFTSFYHAIIELILDLWIFTDKICLLVHLPDEKYISAMLLSTISFWSINALLCSRNWMVTLVALARLEAIFRPLKIRSNSVFSSNKSRLYTVIVLVSSYSLSVIRIFYKTAIICEHDKVILFEPHLHRSSFYQCFEIIFFIYQSVFPVIVVTISTLMMIYFLFKQTFKSSYLLKQYLKENETQVMTSQQRATLTITVLAGVFTVTEIPIFIITLLKFTYPDVLSNNIQILYQITRVLVVLDSCCNFLIYASTSEHYRRDLCYLFQRIFRWHKIFSNEQEESFGMTRIASYIPNSRRHVI